MITRSQWGARKPRKTPDVVKAREWAMHWEGPGMGGWPHDQCPGKVRSIQGFHMDTRGWSDIAYNFVVCPHGFVYEGRGWDVMSAATKGANGYTLAACYLGGEGDPFTDRAKAALNALFAERKTWPVHPHSHYFATACPGDVIRAWLTHRTTPPQGDDDMPLTDHDFREVASYAIAATNPDDMVTQWYKANGVNPKPDGVAYWADRVRKAAIGIAVDGRVETPGGVYMAFVAAAGQK